MCETFQLPIDSSQLMHFGPTHFRLTGSYQNVSVSLFDEARPELVRRSPLRIITSIPLVHS
jgi:hypothetical protein